MKKQRYTEEQIREILTTAYPGKTEEEIKVMAKETMEQYLAEETKTPPGPNKKRKNIPPG